MGTIAAMDIQTNIRMATPEDAQALLDIYTPYVLETAVTFEIDPPTVEDFRSRIEHTLQSYPYLVAEKDGEILGYAYAKTFRPRAAYSHSAESSIYIRKDLRSRGLGRRLYEALAKLLLMQNVFNMEACIAHCEPADEYVPEASRLFHTRLGFKHAGSFHHCALKFGRWYDMIWMEKILANRTPQETSPFRPLRDVPQPYIDAALNNA